MSTQDASKDAQYHRSMLTDVVFSRFFTPCATPCRGNQKCDEQPNEHGACQTCVRLRLQCLGFGAKRPDWMRVGVRRRRYPPQSHPY